MNCINYLKASILFVFLLFGSASITNGNNVGAEPAAKNDYNTIPVECDEIDVKLEITNTSNNQQNGKIVMNFKDSTISYTCFRSIPLLAIVTI